MIITWNINRYSRCYSDASKQCLDAAGFNPIFQYFAHFQTRQSQIVGDVWSSINRCDTWNLQLILDINASRQVFLKINLIVNSGSEVVILENLIFPRDFILQFKISARKESIGFRYVINEKKYLFQIFFDNEYDCHLCFDSFSRFGLFSGHWSEPFQFLSPIVRNMNTLIEDIHLNTNSTNGFKMFESNTSHSFPLLETVSSSMCVPNENENYLNNKTPVETVDPDVTQLEIEDCTSNNSNLNIASTIAESQSVLKRQLISVNDKFDLKLLQQNLMSEMEEEN